MKDLVEQLLLNRVNRKLASGHTKTRIRLCRYDSRWFSELGRCYETDERNCCISKFVDLEELSKEVGATTPASTPTI